MQQSLRRLPSSNAAGARRRGADGDCCGHGAALACPSASRTATGLLRAAAGRAAGYEDVVETVDAQVVLEAPGSAVLNRFQEHQEASDICSHLEALSLSLDAVLQETETVIEAQKWDGYTLPADVKEEFVHTYRHARKEDERAKKEARKLRRVLRDVEAAATAATAPAPDAAQQHATQQQQQQQLDGLQAQPGLHAPDAASMRQPPAAAPARQRQPPRTQQQPLLEVRQQQQPDRQRRRRSSATAAAAAAAAAAPAPAAAPGSASEAAVPAAPVDSPSSSDSSSSPPSRRRSREPQPHAAAAAAPAEAATANRGGPAGPRPALELGLPALSSPAAAHASSSSSSSQAAAPGFTLALGLGAGAGSSRARAVSRPGASRTLRAAGIGTRAGRSSAAGAVAAGAPPSMSAKLADNNIHGLDMRMELLSADQEKELAVMVQDLLQLEAAAKELTAQLGRPPTDLEWMQAAGAAAGPGEDPQAALHAFMQRLRHARQAKQVMISANYKLVVSICRKYQGYGMALGDLINEGISGLVRGVERFEPSKGCKFSTYAHWWIRQAVTRSLSDQGRLVRLPAHLQEIMTKMTKLSRSYEAQYGREPTLAELSRELGVDAGRIQDAYEAVFTPRSLDQPVGDGEGATLGDIVEDEHMLGPEDAVYIESLKHDLEGVLANLPPREAGVVRMRFGLADGHERTLDEIGAQYNVTRERIRQIEAKAIRQLRARQLQAGSVLADYQAGEMDAKQVAARTSSGTRKQS